MVSYLFDLLLLEGVYGAATLLGHDAHIPGPQVDKNILTDRTCRMYWYIWGIGIAFEITAAAVVIDYWPNTIPVAVWITYVVVAVSFRLDNCPRWMIQAEH